MNNQEVQVQVVKVVDWLRQKDKRQQLAIVASDYPNLYVSNIMLVYIFTLIKI